MINWLITILALAASVVHGSANFFEGNRVLGASATAIDYSSSPISVETKTSFTKREVVESTRIPFKTQYTPNPDLDAEVENVVQAGKDGETRNIYTLTYWQAKLTDKTLQKTETVSPQDKIIEVGTKFSWKEVIFDGTTYRYWKKMKVRATSYDGNCQGCLGRTWAGTPVQLGTCAVDPKVIVMGSHFYVPGYGVCSALDKGGAIKGNRIDLGFPDVSKGFWSTRNVDIYLLDGEPKT